MAQSSDNPEFKRAQLLKIAKQFVEKVRQGFSTVDASGNTLSPKQLRHIKEFKSFDDGESFLMEIRLGRLEINQTVYGVKRGDDILLSLSDFASAAHFAINVKADEGTADGWFIRENQLFALDTKAGTAKVKDKDFTVTPNDFMIDNGDILIRSQSLAQWFGMSVDARLSMQRLDVATGQRWPIEEKILREKRLNTDVSRSMKPPQLPRKETEYAAASIPNVDFNLRQRYKRDPKAEDAEKETNLSVISSGDLAGHTVRTVLNGSSDQHLETAYVTFTKESEDSDLLGPLKARSYEFGDISSVPVPNTGSSPSELGAHVTNRNFLITSSTTTVVEGIGEPGWDVELYRNDQLVNTVRIDNDGRYIFNDVFIYAGDNQFRIVQYGPLGEVREETRSMTVNPALTEQGKGIYDVSLTSQNTNTWNYIDSKDPDRNTPHFAGTYAYQLTPRTSVYTGTMTRQENRDQKTYLSGGFATSLGKDTILNFDAAYDIDDPYFLSTSLRRRLASQNLSFSARHQSDDFSNNSGNQDTPSSTAIATASAGPIPYLKDHHLSYEAISSFIWNGNDTSSNSRELSLYGELGRLYLTNRLQHSITKTPLGSETRANGSFAVRGNALNTRWRGSIGYSFEPDTSIDEYLIGAAKRLARKWSGDLTLRYKTENQYKVGDLSLSWDGDQVRVSPEISYDSDGVLNAQMNVRFGLTRDPLTKDIVFSGRSLSNTGGISARVFLDNDGDNIFSEGDEWLPDTVVQAVQFNRETFTDDQGQAFLYDIPTTRITDIQVDPNGLPDPTYIPAYAGASMRLRPGEIAKFDFPIHKTGEMDGTIYAAVAGGSPRPLRGMTIHIYDETGRKVASSTTENDGYYFLEKIPPGKYSLILDPGSLARAHLSSPPPEEINIGYNGPTMYGHNIIVPEKSGVTFSFLGAGDLKQNYPDMAPTPEKMVVLNLGSYNSPMAMNLVWYKLKTKYASLAAGLTPLFKASESPASVKTGLHTLWVKIAGQNVNDALQRCQALNAHNITCNVEMIPASPATSASTDGSADNDKKS